MFFTARILVGISLPPFDGNDTLILSIATPQKSSKGRGRHPLRIVIVDRENDIALLDDIGQRRLVFDVVNARSLPRGHNNHS